VANNFIIVSTSYFHHKTSPHWVMPTSAIAIPRLRFLKSLIPHPPNTCSPHRRNTTFTTLLTSSVLPFRNKQRNIKRRSSRSTKNFYCSTTSLILRNRKNPILRSTNLLHCIRKLQLELWFAMAILIMADGTTGFKYNTSQKVRYLRCRM